VIVLAEGRKIADGAPDALIEGETVALESAYERIVNPVRARAET
jgi:hypothetical protein